MPSEHNLSYLSVPGMTTMGPQFDDPGNVEDPPCPSFLLDLAWTRRCGGAERRRDIDRWRSVI